MAPVLAILSLPPALAQAAQPAAPSACLSCVILQVPAGSAGASNGSPGSLDGLTIAVDAAETGAETALRWLQERGATPALLAHVDAPLPAPSLLGLAAVVLAAGVEDDPASVYRLRTLATLARSVRPGVRVLVVGATPPGRVEAYVDGRVAPGGAVAPDVEVLTGASLAPGSDVVLLALPEVAWEGVAAFAGRRGLRSGVTAEGSLTAEEVVARHQAQRRRQDRLVRQTIAHGTTTVLFEVPGFAAPVTITADTVQYRRPDQTDLEQIDIRVNGASIAGGGASSPPRLPLLEAERVATPPLTITLDDEYRYTLAGRETVAGAESYVVAFEAAAPSEAPAHGRAWIDAGDFALRRLEVVQPRLRGAIVSSEQHETYGPFTVAGETVWLPVATRVYQRYEGAGHRTPIHRTLIVTGYAINPEDFDARLRAAHASPHVMLRETPQGVRYLLREPGARPGDGRSPSGRSGERIRTAVAGVIVDPNITVPLPFAGFSYVDFNLLGTGAQLNLFFGGTYGQLSWSVPSIAGTAWEAHGRGFGIAARYNDRSFRGGVEQYGENITQRPAHVSAGVGRPLARRVRVRLDYELDYTAFDRATSTAATFVVPVDAVVHGGLAALETDWGAWSARAWWNPARRQRWRPWGDAAAPADTRRSFQRAGVSVTRTLALGRTLASRLEGAWMGGAGLDRFSRYSFGTFENRLHGYPSAGIRYDAGGVLRTVTSWTGPGVRLDAFGDVAAVRDPGFGERLRVYPGVGAAVEVAGPARTLWSVEWGYGVRGIGSDGSRGTQALRITGFRTF